MPGLSARGRAVARRVKLGLGAGRAVMYCCGMDAYDRRVFVKMTLPGFLGLGMALPGIAQQARQAAALDGRKRPGEPMEWGAFIESVSKFAQRRVVDDWSEQTYVKRVAGMARRLNIEDPKLQEAFKGYVNKNPTWPEFEALHKEERFEVALVEFEKGERIAPPRPPADQRGHLLRIRRYLHSELRLPRGERRAADAA